ncbi:MAG TPA: type II and III secretion system protein, partial [Candidatus Baltobacteraceae bacterium]|nr:type II and III secretion system protein [Candidatus Baltobacteraceae bacterium]
GNIGPTWDVALQAAASDNNVTVIQRPRIQTSQAKPAQFFVGSTVPYITGTSYGTGLNGNSSSSYSQLSVGVELDVTPFINPDGLVVMDVQSEIDDLGDNVLIDGNPVPKTTKRTLNSEIAVKDKDTIILGGFIRSDRTKNRSGVPLLKDIPLLGVLFSSRSDTKDRQELIVLMRPTVLRTPEIAAQQTLIEEQRLPGVSAAAAENDKQEAKQIETMRKASQKRTNIRNENSEFFTPVPAPPSVDTNIALPLP